MKNQYNNKNKPNFLLIIIGIFYIFIGYCNQKDKKNSFLWEKNSQKNYYEIKFLQKDISEIQNLSIQEVWKQFLNKDYSNYKQVGIPTQTLPYFENDCFFNLDEFRYYNEFGLIVRYCSNEIQENLNKIKSYLENINSNSIFSNELQFNNISLKKSNNLNSLEEENFTVILDAFENLSFKNKAKLYIRSSAFFENKENFIPRRFYKNQYGIFINENNIFFIYKIDNFFLTINIKEKSFIKEVQNALLILKDFLKEIEISENKIFLGAILYENKNLKEIKLSTKELPFYEENLKKNLSFFIFPYSNFIIQLQDFSYNIKENKLTLNLKNPYEFPLDNLYGKIHNHWIEFYKDGYMPLPFCFWEEPCSIKDLNLSDFIENIQETNYDCTIQNLDFSEINPFGLYTNERINSFAKFIEIKNHSECENKRNIIYVKVDKYFIKLPEKLKSEYYLISGTDKYLTENFVESSYLQSLNVNSQISFIQFFPFREKKLIHKIPESKPFFIYGDPENKIFKKIHSLIIENNVIFSFHDENCKGLIECEYYGMSPGYENKLPDSKVCKISEIYIGGPHDENKKTISSDEFIEFECKDKSNLPMNFLEVINKNQSKIYYFPKPLVDRFSIFSSHPICLHPENFIEYPNLTIPNSKSTFKTNEQIIYITDYDINQSEKSLIPRSLNYLENEQILLPSINKNLFINCTGSATPSQENQTEITLVRINHNSFKIIPNEKNHYIKIFKNENFIQETRISPNQILTVDINQQPFFPDERSLLQFFVDDHILYREIFIDQPSCSIDAIHPDTPEWVRICFYKNLSQPIYIKDENAISQIIPFHERFSSYTIENKYLEQLEPNFYNTSNHECMILIEPNIYIKEFPIKQDSRDKYLVTVNTHQIGNGIRNDETIEIFIYLNNQKISLCSYGIPEIKSVPFKIPENKSSIRWKPNPYSDFDNFEITD